MKLLCLLCLLTGGSCPSSADMIEIYAHPNTMASLPCPVETGDVTWSYLTKSGLTETLVSIVNGEERITNRDKYGSQADNALLIKKVNPSDSRMYFCNKRKVYLFVTTDPNMLAPKAGNRDPDSGGSDSGTQESSDLWKVPVGVVIGAVSVLLVLLTLRSCSKRGTDTSRNQDKATAEVVYEEISAVGDQLGRGSDVESPYWTSITVTPNTPTLTNSNLYSTVSRSKDPSRGECVYYLAQSPAQTGAGLRTNL
ncbi:uncharacterized protein LOC141809423 [Halichoeres trimaculatus]|uniref:uncharacterized protein LOC141809423 n=1 Tax=Halichoeres trimaculatus TaxID=147232 RepID=UPI003D9F8502